MICIRTSQSPEKHGAQAVKVPLKTKGEEQKNEQNQAFYIFRFQDISPSVHKIRLFTIEINVNAKSK